MNFRIIAIIIFTFFYILGLNRSSITDDELTYLKIVEFKSENISAFIMHALSYSSNIGHLILMKLSGSYYNLIKFFTLLLSWFLLDNEFKFKNIQFRKCFPFFLFPYFFISGTFLRDDLIISVVLLIVYVILKFDNNKKYIYLTVLLLILFYLRFYWSLIICLVLLFLVFRKKKILLFFLIIPIIYYIHIFGVNFSDFFRFNPNVFKFFYSPIPWKIQAGVEAYESTVAYWLLFTLKLFLTLALLGKKVRIKNWNLVYLALPILVFQNFTELNGPRQTTIFIGLFLCSLVTLKKKTNLHV
jgi:hypothetical protein